MRFNELASLSSVFRGERRKLAMAMATSMATPMATVPDVPAGIGRVDGTIL